MEHDHSQHEQYGQHQASRGKWVLIGFMVVAAFFLWTEHRAHVLGVLPYLLFLACPLMHLFHHHGHHHRHGADAQAKSDGQRAPNGREAP